MISKPHDTTALTLDIDQPEGAMLGDGRTELLANEVDENVKQSIPAGFQIATADQANWLVRRILDAREYRTKVNEWAEIERQRAEREEQSLLFLFGNQLRLWVTLELGRLRGKRKSINLPRGVVGYRHAKAALLLEDAEAAMQWARTTCPAAIQITERLSKTLINEHFAATGEVPPGTAVEPEREVFFIR